jgi:hypothetical protein
VLVDAGDHLEPGERLRDLEGAHGIPMVKM